MAVLVTGGTGYIGSHTVVELLKKGYEVVIVDNLSNSKSNVIGKIEKITGKTVKFYEMDLRDREKLSKVFTENKIEYVIHFAGYKAVGESVEKPLEYYNNNLISTIVLLEEMKKNNVKKIVFSSSATVYGEPKKLPITEESEVTHSSNPYGETKIMIERMLSDLYNSDNTWGIVILRYFNPVGANESRLLGESPNGIPNNLMPFINQVAIGIREKLNVFGNDYKTVDGTGVRDYIHVVDLAKGHINAIEKIENENTINYYNLGTGKGFSVLQIVEAYEKANNIKINYEIKDRRPGDIAECYAETKKARQELNWSAEKNLEDMCKDSYEFIINEKNND